MKSLDRISGYAHVALQYGLEEAIFLDSLMYWYKENRANGRNFRDGRWWTYNSVSAFVQLFPWWSAKQLRRIIERCREKGALLDGHYNENPRDRTLWYTPSDELLELYGIAQTGNCICPNGQTDLPEQANGCAQTGKCYKDHVNTHVDTMKDPLPPKAGFACPQGSRGAAQTSGTDGIRPQGSERAAQAPRADEVSPVFDEYAGEDRELRERLEEFRETRKRKKKPLQTRRAAVILTGKLDRLSGGDRACKLALLDNAILHGWDSVYPLKDDEAPPGTGRQDKPLRDDWVTFS